MGKSRCSELGKVRFAQQGCPGLLQVGQSSGVLIGDEVGEETGAASGADAHAPKLVLHSHGDSVHGPQIVALGNSLLRLLRGLQCLLAAHGNIGVELEVQIANSIQVGLRNLNGRDFFALN